jgi:hypothetical protein
LEKEKTMTQIHTPNPITQVKRVREKILASGDKHLIAMSDLLNDTQMERLIVIFSRAEAKARGE